MGEKGQLKEGKPENHGSAMLQSMQACVWGFISIYG